MSIDYNTRVIYNTHIETYGDMISIPIKHILKVIIGLPIGTLWLFPLLFIIPKRIKYRY